MKNPLQIRSGFLLYSGSACPTWTPVFGALRNGRTSRMLCRLLPCRQKIAHAVACPRSGIVKCVRIEVQRRTGLGVPEICRDCPRVRAGDDLQGGVQMSEVMHSVERLIGALTESLEPCIRRVRVHWLSIFARKEPPEVVPLIAQRKPCRVLVGSVRPQDIKTA